MYKRQARETGVEVEQVMRDISTGGIDGYLVPYTTEIEDVLSMLATYQERRAIIAATTLLVYRVDPSWDIEDTLALHPDLRDALHLLFEDEENKSIEALEKLQDNVEKDSGKP